MPAEWFAVHRWRLDLDRVTTVGARASLNAITNVYLGNRLVAELEGRRKSFSVLPAIMLLLDDDQADAR